MVYYSESGDAPVSTDPSAVSKTSGGEGDNSTTATSSSVQDEASLQAAAAEALSSAAVKAKVRLLLTLSTAVQQLLGELRLMCIPILVTSPIKL